ncbi:MAG: hypothetical protein HUJ30_00280, partial [Gammaproteobacteria bacterium]|nr:hypothetical protein [Gammaproteobacteria bacterium]
MRWFSLAMVVMATILLQVHAWLFWSDFVGPDTGWLWAVVLEASALWLWANRDQQRRAVVPFLASMLVLAGPLAHIIEPPIKAEQRAIYEQQNRPTIKAELRDEIATLQASLETSQRNSEKRTGWLTDIQQTRNLLNQKRGELRRLNAEKPSTQGLGLWLKAIMQGMALIVIWSVSVRAISQLTKFRVSKPVDSRTVRGTFPSRQKSETPASAHAERTALHLLAQRVNEALDKVL